MSTLESLLLSAATAEGTQFWLDVAVKATALLLAAIAANVILRRSSAALRHRVWCLTFAALVLLPALSAALPEWRLEILPRVEEGTVATEAAIAATPPTAAEIAEVVAPLAPPAEQASFDPPARGEALPDAFALAPSLPPASVPAVGEEPPSASAAAWQLPGLATVWFAGVGLALAPLAIGLARMFVLRRQSQAVACAVWAGLVDEVRARLGLTRRVALLETRRSVMPMTWGLVRPTVLLPSQARDWSERLRRIVLLHELAHVKRCDVGFQLLGRLTCALYWFHPLAWYALRRLRIERELACDDCVVHSGELASDYAAELLQIARTYQPVRLAAAIAMAQRSSLEHRIRAMFDRACSHLPVSARAARLLLVGVIVFVTTLAAIRLAPRASAEDKKSDQPSESAATDSESKVATTESETPDAKTARSELHGRVVDEDGRPIAGARVRLLRIDTERTTWADQGQIVAASQSAADGTFAIERPSDKPFATGEHFSDSSNFILADAENHVFDWQRVSPGEPGITLQLSTDDAPIEGRVLDLEGRPVAGVRVGVNEISGGAKDLDQWVEAAKRNPDTLDESLMMQPIDAKNSQPRPAVARYPGSENLQPGLASLLPSATTDANGSFRLAGLGRDRLVRLELAGSGIAKTWLNVVTRDMPAVPYPDYDPRFRVQTCFGRRFDFTSEPEQPIAGIVRDADSGRPLAGVEVRLNQYADSLLFVEGFLATVTDEQGRYELRGVSKPHDRERSHRLRFVPHADQPYFRTNVELAKRDGFDPVQCNVELKRAVWLRGRVVDTATGKPIQGLVEYYPFLSNEAAADYANFEPGMHLMEGDRYATDENGGYQIPVLPGRGLAAFIAKDAQRYPQGDGVDAIADLRQEGGHGLNIYHLISLDLATAFREINPPPGAAEAICDIELKSLDVARVKLVDVKGQPLEGAVALRLAPHRIEGPHQVGWPQEPLLDATAEIIGPREQSRTVMFLHRERKLAAALLLTPQSDPPDAIVLRPTATLSGRIVDRDRKPVAELGLTVSALPPPGAEPLRGWVRESLYYSRQLAYATTGSDGSFRIEQVPPGVAYVIFARRGAEQATTRVVQPGEQLDLGEVTLEEPKDAKTAQAKAPTRPEPAAVAPAGEAEAAETKAPARESKAKVVRGRVTRDGRPASGADVAVIARNMTARRGGDLGPQGVVLAEGTTDEKGEYVLNLAKTSAKSHAYASIIARQEGAAIAWQQLNREAVDRRIDLELPAEKPIRGKLIDLEGRPAASVSLTVRQIANPGKSGEASGVGYQGDKVPAAWLAPVVSDEQGRFVVRGVPTGHGVFMEVGQDERFAPQEIDLSPGADEQRGERDATYRPLVKNLKPGEEAVLTLSPAQPFAGTVRYADSGQPAPHARISIWASQQEGFGSMSFVSGRADENGRYQIRPKPGVRFGLIAYPPDGAPYLARQTPLDEPLRWNASERVKQVDLSLPRGVLVNGTIVEAGGNTSVAGAAIQYIPESSNNPNASDEILTGGQAIQLSDEDGRFSIAVLPGPGRLLVSSQQGNYVFQQIGDRELGEGKPGGIRSYAHAIAKLNPQVGQETLQVKLELQPGSAVNGRIVDEQGQAIEEATVISRLSISPYSLFWRGHTTPALGGRFELTGLAKDTEYPVYFLDPKRRLGATEIIKAGEGERTVVLKPCGQARLRAVDKNGEPGADHVSVEMVVTPGALRYDFEAVRNGELAADADYIANIDRTNHWNRPQSDEKGHFVLPALIPGATYRVITGRGGTLKVVKEFQVQSNETLDLGEILIERIE